MIDTNYVKCNCILKCACITKKRHNCGYELVREVAGRKIRRPMFRFMLYSVVVLRPWRKYLESHVVIRKNINIINFWFLRCHDLMYTSRIIVCFSSQGCLCGRQYWQHVALLAAEGNVCEVISLSSDHTRSAQWPVAFHPSGGDKHLQEGMALVSLQLTGCPL